jgi:hypothetical protein
MWSHPLFFKVDYSEEANRLSFFSQFPVCILARSARQRFVSPSILIMDQLRGSCFIAALYGVMQYFGIELIWPTHLILMDRGRFQPSGIPILCRLI